MKKIILLGALFLLTACDSTEVFEKECIKRINSENTKFIQNVKFVYTNTDEVLNVIVTNKYKSTDNDELELIKESASSYNNNLVKSGNISVQIVKDKENEYILRYNFDVQNMNEEELNNFNLKQDWIKLNNKIRESDLECK